MITSKGLAALIKKGGLNWTQALYFLISSELVKVGRVLFEKFGLPRERGLEQVDGLEEYDHE